MWFLCAIAGAALGAMVGQFNGFFIGAVLGVMIGLSYERRARLQELERRVSTLEAALAPPSAAASPEADERGVTLDVAPAAEPEPESVRPPAPARESAPPPRKPAAPAGPNLWERLFG